MYQEKLQPKGLAAKDVTAFKSILKLHEHKQYKKGLKAADTLLKTYPCHGETLALKGLILFSMDKHTEAYETVRKALRHDVNSALCWDVMSHLQLEKKNFREAAKCVSNALVHQPDNLHLIRELTALHVQNRDYPNYQKYSLKLLQAKPGQKTHWMGYAVACTLVDEHHKALGILDKYRQIQKNTGIISSFEESELLFFKATIHERAGELEEAIKSLDDNKALITDKEEWKSKKAELLTKLGRPTESAELWLNLVNGNPENWTYHRNYLVASGVLPSEHPSCFVPLALSDESVKKLTDIYDGFVRKYPFARACRQIPFAFISGEAFEKRFTAYLSAGLTKGTISVFHTIKYLYADPSKVEAIEKIALNLASLLEQDKPLPNNTDLEPPSSILFANYFLAQHFCRVKKFSEALTHIDKCIQHTPTQVDWYTYRARILKAAGDPVSASNWLEKARTLDLADRYLNTKATKYFLRADKVQEAEDTISIFTKMEADTEQNYNNILDMQVTWYELEEGESWVRQGNYGQALKRFFDVKKHYDTFRSDQMDFHQYCTRKMTLRQYLNILREMDTIYKHPTYARAAMKIVKTYLYIHDRPLKAGILNDTTLAGVGEEEKKSLLSSKKKEDAKKQKELEEKKAALAKRGKTVDSDYFGDKLLHAGLAGAVPLVQDLQTFSPKTIESHLLAFEVHYRRGKLLLALQAVNKARALDAQNPDLHYAIVRLFHKLESQVSTLNPKVQDVVNSEKTAILGGDPLQDFNKKFFEAHKSVARRIAYYRSSVVLGEKRESLLPVLKDTSDATGHFEEFAEILDIFKSEFSENEAREWKTTCHSLFPLATVFKEQEQTSATKETTTTTPGTEEEERRNWFERFLNEPKL